MAKARKIGYMKSVKNNNTLRWGPKGPHGRTTGGKKRGGK